MTAPALTSTDHTAVQIIRALELSGPANWRTIRDCYLEHAHRAAMPAAMRVLIDGGHVVARVTDRKYLLVIFERGEGLPEWLNQEAYDVARATPLAGIRRRTLAPTKTARSRR